MVARGEIAFLIASIAESKGVFGQSENGVYMGGGRVHGCWAAGGRAVGSEGEGAGEEEGGKR